MKFLKTSLLAALMPLVLLTANAQEKQADKIKAADDVLQEFSKMKENIPAQLFKITEGIIVIPKLINAGLVVAGKRGKGIAMVRNTDGVWSNPVFVTLTGGSAGLQAGVQAVDLVLVFKKRETLQNIGKGSFTLGGDISVTAGPVGRNSTASTDYKLEAEVYSYSKSKGLFAGISVNGSSLHIDGNGIKDFYGEENDAATLFADGTKDESPKTVALKETLNTIFR